MIAMYKEIEHTADYAIWVTGSTMEELFREAARGMNALTGAHQGSSGKMQLIELEATDIESLLVTWLEELALLLEMNGEMFMAFEKIELSDTKLRAQVHTCRSSSIEKLIKAVTYHDLDVKSTQTGYETIIVFDV